MVNSTECYEEMIYLLQKFLYDAYDLCSVMESAAKEFASRMDYNKEAVCKAENLMRAASKIRITLKEIDPIILAFRREIETGWNM